MNALMAASYDALLQGSKAHVIFTDPPYNVPIDGHVSGMGEVKHREFAMASGEMTQEQFTTFLRQNFQLMTQHSHAGSIHFICMDWRHISEVMQASQNVYAGFKNLCVWMKDNGGMGSLYRSQHELVFVFKHGTAPHRNNVELGKHGRYRTNIWQYPCAKSFSKASDEGNLMALHPTVKPVALVVDALLDVSARGEIVLDPFLGSGTTLIAAEKVGRVCYGLELDPVYCDTIIRRWQTWTGEKAIHAASGMTFDERAAAQEVAYA